MWRDLCEADCHPDSLTTCLIKECLIHSLLAAHSAFQSARAPTPTASETPGGSLPGGTDKLDDSGVQVRLSLSLLHRQP